MFGCCAQNPLPYSYDSVPSQAGKVIVVTGANQGLGLSLVKDYLGMNPAAPGLPKDKQPAAVIVACRSREKTEAAIKEHLNSDPRVRFLELDLASFASVRAAADALTKGSAAFGSPVDRIDTLVLNAGILCEKGRETTKDGMEMTMGVCHVGHFLFTKRVWPLVTKSKSARVVSVSSVGHTWTTTGIDFEDMDWQSRKYDGFEAYFQAKLANVYFCRELATRCGTFGKAGEEAQKLAQSTPNGNVTVTTLTPGFGKSGLYRECSVAVKLLAPFVAADCDGLSLNSLRAACDLELPSGEAYLSPARMNFYGPPIIADVSDLAKDAAEAKALWEKTEQLIGEKFVL